MPTSTDSPQLKYRSLSFLIIAAKLQHFPENTKSFQYKKPPHTPVGRLEIIEGKITSP